MYQLVANNRPGASEEFYELVSGYRGSPPPVPAGGGVLRSGCGSATPCRGQTHCTRVHRAPARPRQFSGSRKLAGHAEYGENGQLAPFTPHPYVAGIGKIDGRPIAVVGEDYTIKGGSDSGGGRRAAQGRAGRLH